MQLLGITLARTLGWIELTQLNPRGKIFYPELVREIVQRYNFQKFPQKVEQFDEQKGVEFLIGRIGDKVIDKFTIFNTLLTVETRSSTADSQTILADALEWGKAKFGLNYEMIKWGYVSELIFQTDFPLIRSCSDPLSKLAVKTGKAVSEIWGENLSYEPALITAAHDPLKRKYVIAGFQINYLRDHPFSEYKYYSQSPLPTDMHIKLLEEFEADVVSQLSEAKVAKQR